MSKVAVVYHSGFGHTAVLAEKVAQGARDAGADAELLPIEGLNADFAAIVARAGEADAIVFGAPTYMGGPSAPFKAFADASAGAWFSRAWADKLAAGFTVSHSFSGDKLSTLQYFVDLAAQHGMNWISLGLLPGPHAQDDAAPGAVNRLGSYLGVMAQADNAGPDVTPPEGDRETARLLGVRVAEAAQRWAAGAQTKERLAA